MTAPATSEQSPEADAAEDPDYLSRQLITCLGNKRALLVPIADAVAAVRRRLGGRRLRVLDGFSGSGIVSRYLKQHASFLAANDLETYAAVVARCHLRNRSTVDTAQIREVVDGLNTAVRHEGRSGFIESLYAPRDEACIGVTDRVFYTRENARRLDSYRQMIGELPPGLHDLCLGPLLSDASIHANTAGVFKGFYKDRRTGVGRFGGSHADALDRIRGEIRLEPPVLSLFECDVQVTELDVAVAAAETRDLDLAYFDPPYNQHPYGSNYFMLNLVATYRPPATISPVSGIPANWNRSGFNQRARALPLLRHLCEVTDARFLLVSYNDEGFIPLEDMRALLAGLGSVEIFTTRYAAFRGSRNLRQRPLHVHEHLFLVERH